MTQTEINAHAAALGVATDASSARETPPDAMLPSCGECWESAEVGGDPLEAVAARRVEIEAARDHLEAAVTEFVDAHLYRQLPCEEWQVAFDRVLVVGWALRELRKGTT